MEVEGTQKNQTILKKNKGGGLTLQFQNLLENYSNQDSSTP